MSKAERKKILANKVYSDSTLKSWTKEQLIEQIRVLEHNWSCAEENYNNAVKNSDKIFAEQKAEIEAWKVKAKSLEELWETSSSNEVDLQKQVNELKAQAGVITFKDLMKKITCNPQIEIYYDDCEYVNQGTVENIKRMYAWDYFLCNKKVESITISEETKALMITLWRNCND